MNWRSLRRTWLSDAAADLVVAAVPVKVDPMGLVALAGVLMAASVQSDPTDLVFRSKFKGRHQATLSL